MKNRKLHFVGIKGTGMAALARICYKLGYGVQGSDIESHFFTEDSLIKLGIPIYNFDEKNIEDGMSVIVGNAFGDDHIEVLTAKNNETVKVMRYHEFLGEIMNGYRTIAVSGSHGKTTTTTLLRDMLSYTKETGYLIGDGRGDLVADDEYFAVEACEFRRHFLAYHPDVAIMTNFEIDHVDYFKSEEDYLSSFEEFSNNVKELLIVWGDDPHFNSMNFTPKVWTYGFSDENKIRATEMVRHSNKTEFDVYNDSSFVGHFELPIVGDHMVLDALAVIAVGIYEGIEATDIEAGLIQFSGAKRRYVVEEGAENVYIDDYAHHPTEISVTLDATRTRYPGKKIVAIFKPHRTGRVAYFGDQFADALKKADHVFLCPFTSIDDFEEGIDIDITYLQDKIPNSEVIELDDRGLGLLADLSPCVYVFMSSKDIYDLKDALKMRFND